MFEENGQIIRLDERIIELVCQDIVDMRMSNCKVVPISINLSRLHLYQPGIIDKIEMFIKQYKIRPSEIVFEITESALLDDKDGLNALIERLHKLGFLVEMDDYGTGISSLSSLSSFAFDTIKLDKTFIDKIGDKKIDIVIQSTIKMAKDLKMGIVAEGIETKEQVDFLIKNGCFVVQGFYFYKPLQRDTYFLELRKAYE